MSDARGLLVNSSIYAAGIIAARSIGFVLLPLYTHYLSPQDYGTLALLDMVGTYINIVVAAGFTSALLRFYHEKEEQAWYNTVFATALGVVLCFGVVAIVLTILVAPWLSRLVLDTDAYGFYLTLIVATVALEAGNNIFITLYRLREEAVSYIKLIGLRILCAVPLNIYFIAFLKLGILGFILANIIAASVIFVLIGGSLIYRFGARPRFDLAKQLFHFSIPFVPASFINILINSMGIICLTATGNVAAAGLFAVGQKFGTIINMLNQPLGMVWTPHMYKIARNADAPEIYARVATYFVIFLGGAALGLGVFAQDIVDLMTDDSFAAAGLVILPIALGYVLLSLIPNLRIGLSLAKQTKYFPLLSAAGAAAGFPLTYVLASRYGAVGAAWGTLAAPVVTVSLTALLSERHLHVPYEILRLLKVAVAMALCLIVAAQLPADQLAWRLPVPLAFPLLLYLLRVPQEEELAWLGARLSKMVASIRRS